MFSMFSLPAISRKSNLTTSYYIPMTRRLMWDFDTLHQVAQEFPDQSPLKSKAMYVATEIMNTFDFKDPSSVNKCRKVAEQVLGEDWEKQMEEGRKQSAEGV